MATATTGAGAAVFAAVQFGADALDDRDVYGLPASDEELMRAE